jgi:hypothetical protein
LARLGLGGGTARGAATPRLGRPLRLPWLLAALPLLGVARLLPASGFGLWLRLAAATLVLLIPGRIVARALGRRSGAGTLTWGLTALAAALALTLAVHGSIWLTLGLLGAIGIAALPFAGREVEEPAPLGRALALLAGIGFGVALWHVAGIVHGDALFHLARVRKLDELGSLSLRTVDEFRDGGLHPGYAFPLWHALLALVAKLAGVDPALVLLHEPSVLAPLAFLVAFELGLAVFRSQWQAAAVLAASVSLYALAPGLGGSYATLALPGVVGRQLLGPALVAAFFAFVRAPSAGLAATIAAAALTLGFVHATDVLFLAVPLAAFVVVRAAVMREDLRAGAAALGSIVVPAALVVVWLAPIAGETASHTPGAAERERALHQYASQLVVHSPLSYHLKAEVFSRAGAVAVAGLALVPLAGLALRRRWAALVLGGSLVLLAIELSSWAFPQLADTVSLSQARRAAGFVPFAIAFAGGFAVLARFLHWLVLPLALGAGIAFQHWYPGDFGLDLHGGGPGWATWLALGGGLVGLALGIVLELRGRLPSVPGGLLAGTAALLFVVPVAVAGFDPWRPRVSHDSYALTGGLVHALRTTVPKRAVVYGDLETSYRIAAAAPVYVANAPPAHVADTRANHPYARRRALLRFLRTGDLAIPRRAGATWLVLRREELPQLQRSLPRAYADGSFVLLRLGGAP